MRPSRRAFVAGFATGTFSAVTTQAKAALSFFHRSGGVAAAVAPAPVVATGAVLTPVSYMTNTDAGRGSGAAVPALSKALRGTDWTYGVGTTQNFHDRQSIAPGASFDLSVIPITLDPFNWIDNVQFYITDGTAAGLTSVLIDGTKDTRYRGMSQPQNVLTEKAIAAAASTTATVNGVTTTIVPLQQASRVRMPVNAVASGSGIPSGTAVIGNTANTVIFAGTINVSSGTTLTFTYPDPAFGYVATLKNDGSSATDRWLDVYYTARPNRGYEGLRGPFRLCLDGTAVDSRSGLIKGPHVSNWVGAAGMANGVMHYPGDDTSTDPTNPQTPYKSRLKAVAYAAANGYRKVWVDDLTGVNSTSLSFFGIPYTFGTTYIDDLCWTSQSAESVNLVEIKPRYGNLYGVTRSGSVHLDNVPQSPQNTCFYSYPANRVLDYAAFIPTGTLGPKFTSFGVGGPTRSTICLIQGLILDTSMSTNFCTPQKNSLNYDGIFIVPEVLPEQGFFGFKNLSGAWASGGTNYAHNVDLGLTWDFTYTAGGYGPVSRIGQTFRQIGVQYQAAHAGPSVVADSVINDASNNVVVVRIGQKRIPNSQCKITVVSINGNLEGIVEVTDASGNPIAYDWNTSADSTGGPTTDNVVFDNGALAGLGTSGYGGGFYLHYRIIAGSLNTNYYGYNVKYPGSAFTVFIGNQAGISAGQVFSQDSSGNPITFSFREVYDSQSSIFGTDVSLVSCAANPGACVGGPQNPSNLVIDIDRLGAGIYDMQYLNRGAQRANSFNLVYSSQGRFQLFPNTFNNTLTPVPVTVSGNTVTGVGTSYSPSSTVTIAQNANGWLMTLGGGATVPSTARWGSTVTVGGQTCKIARQPDGVVAGKNAVYVVVPSGFTAVTAASSWTYAYNKTGLVSGSRIVIGSGKADVLSVNENVVTLVAGSTTLADTSTPVTFTHQISVTQTQIVFTDLFENDYGMPVDPRSKGFAKGDLLFTGYALHVDVRQMGDSGSPMIEAIQDNFCEVKCKYPCTDAQPLFPMGLLYSPAYHTLTTDSTNVATATGLNTCTVTASPDKGSTVGGTVYGNVYNGSSTYAPDFAAGLGAKRRFHRIDMSGGNAGFLGWYNGRGNVRLPVISSAAGYAQSFRIFAATPTDGNGNWTAYVFDDMNVLNGGAFNVAVGDKFFMPHSLQEGGILSLAPNQYTKNGTTYYDGEGTFGGGGDVPANLSNDILAVVTLDPTNPSRIVLSAPPQNYANKTGQQFQHIFSYVRNMTLASVQGNYTRYSGPTAQINGGGVYDTGMVQCSWAVGPYANGPLGFIVPSAASYSLNYSLMGTGIYCTRPSGYSPYEMTESLNGQTNGRIKVFGSVASNAWQGNFGSINGNKAGSIAIDAVTMKPTAASAINIPTYAQLGLVGPFYAHDPDGNDISGLGSAAKVGAYQPLTN